MVLLIQQHVQGYMQRRHAHCMQNAARMLTNAQASTSMIRTPMRHGAKHQAAAADSATTDDQQQDENSSTNDDIEWIEIAKISVHHGVRGEVKVQPLTDFAPQRLGRPGTRYALVVAGRVGPSTFHTQVPAASSGALAPCCTSTSTYHSAARSQHCVQGVCVFVWGVLLVCVAFKSPPYQVV